MYGLFHPNVGLAYTCCRAKNIVCFLVNQRQQSYCSFILQKEREAYEVIVENGKFFYKDGKLLDTSEGDKDTKWIFVLSTSKILYVGKVIFSLQTTHCSYLFIVCIVLYWNWFHFIICALFAEEERCVSAFEFFGWRSYICSRKISGRKRIAQGMDSDSFT